MNPLPQATAFEINPSDLIPKTTRRKDWFSPRIASQTRKETTPHEVTRVYLTAPVERIWAVQQDSHMAAWYEWKGNEPLGFLKMRCREIGIAYSEIIGNSRERRLIGPRHGLMVEVKLKFPHLSNPFIATMFKRDHTVVYLAMQKHGIHTRRKQRNPRRIADIKSRVKKMFEAGESYAEIGIEFDFHPTVVRRLVTKMGWRR